MEKSSISFIINTPPLQHFFFRRFNKEKLYRYTSMSQLNKNWIQYPYHTRVCELN